jgi:ribonuclease HI
MKVVDIFISAYVNKFHAGAYGAVIVENGKTVELSQYYKQTTQRRIRLFGVVSALNNLPNPYEATVYVDSEYIVDGINKGWANIWRKRDWLISDDSKAKNADLWNSLLDLTERHNVDFVWIRKHNGNEYGYEYNARCVELAINAVKRGS